MQGEIMDIGLDNLLGETARIKVEGYRFVTISCVEINEIRMELLYHFDRNFQLKHLRLSISRDCRAPSISPVYFAAFLVENEIQDLFGIRFHGLTVDYDRTLYLEKDVKTAPFCKFAVVEKSPVCEEKTP